MAEAPSLIYNDRPGAIPATYRFPPGLDARLSSVSAVFDGTGAGADFLACLSVFSQDGKLIGRFFPGSAVAAGDVAEVTFAPFLNTADDSTPAGSGIQYDVDNVGDWLEVEATGTVTVPFSQPNGADGTETDASVAVNAAKGMLVTSDPSEGVFPLTVEMVNTAGLGGRGVEVVVSVAGAGVTTATAVDISSDADGSGTVTGAVVAASKANGSTGAAFGLDVSSFNHGSGAGTGARVVGRASGGGDAVGVSSRGSVSGGGAAFSYKGFNTAGALVFAVDDAGNIHIPVGATVINDL